MTRKLLVLIFPLLFLVFVTTVSAQNLSTTGSAQTPTSTNPNLKLKNQVQLLEQQKKAAIMKVREEAKVKIQAKREEFKTRIQTIKDQKKKVLVERIDAKLAETNRKFTAKFSDILVRLQEFLDKIKQRTADAKVLADVAIAQTAIDAAIAAVDEQAAKAYTMDVADETSLRLNAKTVVSQLRQDLSAVHKLVVDAKQAVQKLNQDRELIKKEATKSAEL